METCLGGDPDHAFWEPDQSSPVQPNHLGTRALQQHPAIGTRPPAMSFWVPAEKHGFGQDVLFLRELLYFS